MKVIDHVRLVGYERACLLLRKVNSTAVTRTNSFNSPVTGPTTFDSNNGCPNNLALSFDPR
jgi:hypothetical protein